MNAYYLIEGSSCMIKCAIFDMDGLMFDTERVVGDKLIEVGKEFGYNIPFSLRIQMLGHTKKDNLELFKKTYGEDFPFEEVMKHRIEKVNAYYREYGVPVKKGLFKLLSYLKDNHILVAVCSSTDHKIVQSHLDSTSVSQYVDYVIGGDQVENSKPDPEIFLKAVRHFNLHPQDCMVFEDSRSGILAAHNGGIPVICVPDLVTHDQDITDLTYSTVKDLEEAISVLEEMKQ